MNGNLLTIEHLTKRYGQVAALDDVSFAVQKGERFGVVGESGSGKTTLLRCILGITISDEGRVSLENKDITGVPVEHRGIGYVPQDFGLFPHLSVSENIAFGLRIQKISLQETRSRVETLLKAMQLSEELMSRKPRELSGGQQQRVALARALAVSPKLLLLDEPLSNLDEATKDEVLPYLRTLSDRFGTTAMFVIHTIQDALDLCDRIGVFHRGRLLQVATPHELVGKPTTPQVSRLLAGIRQNHTHSS
ncbi:MAG: hypothetical protein A3A80_00665 [Candidatus Terrybacteria bacterium RIFCSPLOWO2_01_FULL_44_24]|uniref:ABC transporter domain-containing protein n=1 Tax=Candidatus Terrybacteria bacterium RIFCSPHIGHO2_01_FULL_43_35 TaxID=1802361 RepID=A0A1G2PEU0_9BACT|nr:MAG: hypothetical protein A2828_02670 [Candidatus Terrybacteria bacterium RIFCSPHIGHO2_01_FULL_43_35]OHA51437.1 MAG: hypothetical protein A3A80_00665 [Candidatus Terrybacteria bacterium RIFCSPLOWO2_01_FULL_44_24]